MKPSSISPGAVNVALEALAAANDALALHTARGHDGCGPCIEVGVQLIAAEERIRALLADGSIAGGQGPALPRPEALRAWAGRLKLRVH